MFSGIWNAIKGIGGFLSAQFGRLLGWIASLNDTFQGFVTGWRDFFKERNDQREGVAGIKVELPTLDDRTKSQIRQGQQPDFAMDMPPSIEPLTMNVEQPDIAALNVERPDIPSLNVDTPTLAPTPMDLDAQQRRYAPRASSVEYVDFAGVDEIDKTLKSGFDSLIGINDQILVALKKGIITEGYETPAPVVNVAENTIPELALGAPVIDLPALAVDTPVVNVAENTIPELALGAPVIDLPALAVDTPVVNLSGIQTETQPPIFNPPPIQTELPGIDIPQIQTPEALVNVPAIEIPEPQSAEFEVPSLSAPDTVDAGQGDKIEENITFNVYQQPGEDVVELTDRIMGELDKRSRAGYYE